MEEIGRVVPFYGGAGYDEGVGNAMLSGKLAAEVVDRALTAPDAEGVIKEYEPLLWKAAWNELETSYRMQKLGKIGPLLNFVVSKAAKSEKAREAIAGTLVSADAKDKYASPLFYLKLLFS